MKTCTRCGEAKPLTEFGRDKRNADGRFGHCRACERARRRAHYEKNRERQQAQYREWMAERPWYHTEFQSKYRAQRHGCEVDGSEDDREARLALYEYAHHHELEVDHVIPVHQGGPHCSWNLQALSIEEHKEKTRLDKVASM